MKASRPSYYALLLAVLLAVGCSGGSNSGDTGNSGDAGNSGDGDNSNGGGLNPAPTPGTPLVAALPLPMSAPLVVTADTPANASTHIELPSNLELGTLTSTSLDLAAVLSNLTVVRTDGSTTPAPTVDLRFGVVAGNDPVGACGAGAESVGATVTGDATFATTTVSPSTVALSPAALDILNGGSFSVCTTATSSVDAELTLSQLGAAFGFDADCATPALDLVGHWVGTYSCQDLCEGSPSTEGGDVVIDVVQSGETALYSDDSGATYVGSVCGGDFRHFGKGAGYYESGTFTRTGPTTAVKSSTWVSTTIPNCGGTCSDSLTLGSPN